MGKIENKKDILIVIIITLLLIGAGVYVATRFTSKTNEKTPKEEYTNTLIVYKDESGTLCLEETRECKELGLTIKTETNNAKVLHIEKNYVLFRDNGLKLYNAETSKSEKIDLEDKYDKYQLVYYNDQNKKTVIQGIGYFNIETKYNETLGYENDDVIESGFYNITENKKMYEGKYTDFYGINEKYLQAITFNPEEMWEEMHSCYLLTINEEKVVMQEKGSFTSIYAIGKENKYFIVVSTGDVGIPSEEIYTENLKKLAGSTTSDLWALTANGNIRIVKNNIIYEYDADGTEISKSSKYDDIYMIGYAENDFYIIYRKADKLNLSYKNQEVEIFSISKDYIVDGMTSGYVTKEYLDDIKHTKGEGFYIDENEHYSYYINPETLQIEKIEYAE